jgi:hypothetical protein
MRNDNTEYQSNHCWLGKALDTLGQLPCSKAQLPTADRRLRIPSHPIHNFQEQSVFVTLLKKLNKILATIKPFD